MLPFEGCGVDTTWELQMPRAANPFDFRTIADVRVGVDFTALYSPEYAAAVVQQLPTRLSNSIAFSLRNDFPDSWYGLVSQAQTQPPPTTPLVAQFTLNASDFPPNLSTLSIENVTLLLVRQGSSPPTFTIHHLRLNGMPTTSPEITSVGDIVSTRSTAQAAWSSLMGCNPIGNWELGLSANPATMSALSQGTLQDLVLVLSYAGTLPDWPT
jgi:hypothetical protein